ncbi:hypothetical protein K439DRAFT_1641914 [Ramaria rubella]|nr:hypothetical protein K439DRAFT_1641914 [Ramaria rubella]
MIYPTQSAIHEQNLFSRFVCSSAFECDTSENCSALGLKLGERLPQIPLVRVADWESISMQDLAPLDGLFKIFIFPCDIQLVLASSNSPRRSGRK